MRIVVYWTSSSRSYTHHKLDRQNYVGCAKICGKRVIYRPIMGGIHTHRHNSRQTKVECVFCFNLCVVTELYFEYFDGGLLDCWWYWNIWTRHLCACERERICTSQKIATATVRENKQNLTERLSGLFWMFHMEKKLWRKTDTNSWLHWVKSVRRSRYADKWQIGWWQLLAKTIQMSTVCRSTEF